jgi:hypothetical protein
VRVESERLSRFSRIATRTLVAVIALLAILYAGDYGVLRLRAAHPRFGGACDSVHMVRLLAIPLKSGRTEYELDARQPEVTVSCVRALFPHQGYQPCWYVRRNSQKPIPMMVMIAAMTLIGVSRNSLARLAVNR